MKKFVSLLIVIAMILSLTACGRTELVFNKYDETELTNGEWMEVEYLGYHIDTSSAKIIGQVRINWEPKSFYWDFEPTIDDHIMVEIYYTVDEEILAIREVSK